MARRSSRASQRDHFPIANPWLSAVRVSIAPADLSIFEDRRTFHPLQDFRPALTFGKRSSARVIDRVKPARSFRPSNFHFAVPNKVAICVRRKRRKEVLHALGRVGAGSSRRRRRNYYSDVRC